MPAPLSTARVLVGGLLVLLGAALLVAQIFGLGLDDLWPAFVLVPGVGLLSAGLASRARGSEVLTVAGMVVTLVGLLLAYQNATGHWESWAYAWALVGPTGVGLALIAEGAVQGRAGLRDAGRVLLIVGLALFTAGAALFEGVLGISGRDLGPFGDLVLPAVVILLGLLLLLWRRTGTPG